MKNSDLPAAPCRQTPSPQVVEQCRGLRIPVPESVDYPGLTKREHFAATALPGIQQRLKGMIISADDLAKCAVEQADALLAALEES